MTKETAKTNVLMGGEFLIKETNPHSVFIPEEFSEEQKMMISAARDFLNKEIVPNVEAIDKQEEGLTARLLDKAGEVGLLGVAVPEEYGGLGEDFNTNTGISLELGAGFSWSYRFELALAAGATQEFVVNEERVYEESTAVTNYNPDMLVSYLQNKALSDAGRRQLQRIVDQKRQIAENDSALGDANTQMSGLTADEGS